MTALLIIILFLFLALFLGIRAQHGKDMNLEQWSVGGRGFGTIFVFSLWQVKFIRRLHFREAAGRIVKEHLPFIFWDMVL